MLTRRLDGAVAQHDAGALVASASADPENEVQPDERAMTSNTVFSGVSRSARSEIGLRKAAEPSQTAPPQHARAALGRASNHGVTAAVRRASLNSGHGHRTCSIAARRFSARSARRRAGPPGATHSTRTPIAPASTSAPACNRPRRRRADSLRRARAVGSEGGNDNHSSDAQYRPPGIDRRMAQHLVTLPAPAGRPAAAP